MPSASRPADSLRNIGPLERGTEILRTGGGARQPRAALAAPWALDGISSRVVAPEIPILSIRSDRSLGLDRPITRRDFLNGVRLGAGAGLLTAAAPSLLVGGADDQQQAPTGADVLEQVRALRRR